MGKISSCISMELLSQAILLLTVCRLNFYMQKSFFGEIYHELQATGDAPDIAPGSI